MCTAFKIMHPALKSCTQGALLISNTSGLNHLVCRTAHAIPLWNLTACDSEWITKLQMVIKKATPVVRN